MDDVDSGHLADESWKSFWASKINSLIDDLLRLILESALEKILPAIGNAAASKTVRHNAAHENALLNYAILLTDW